MATGDILYQNCAVGGSCTGAGSGAGWVRTVESSGGVSGQCLKLVASANGDHYGDGSTSIETTGISGKSEITVVYWIKFDQSARGILNGNIKAFRPLTGDTYYFATMSPHYGMDYYSSENYGPMTVTDKTTDVLTTDEQLGYSTDLGGGSYSNDDGRFKLNFNAGGDNGFGAYWTKVRHWIKLPTLGGSNGQSKIWINEELVATFTNQEAGVDAAATFNGFTFYPSSEAGEAFEQWMDEMVVYEGYVPPEGTIDTTPPFIDNLSPSGTLASSPSPRNITISCTTDELAVCRFGETDDAYASLTTEFSSTNGLTHSHVLNQTAGTSKTYYVRCIDSDGNANTESSIISYTIANQQVAGPGGIRAGGGVKISG